MPVPDAGIKAATTGRLYKQAGKLDMTLDPPVVGKYWVAQSAKQA